MGAESPHLSLRASSFPEACFLRWVLAANCPAPSGQDVAGRPLAFVMFERGNIERRVVHDETRVESRGVEREGEALAHKYAEYAPTTDNPISFDQ